MTPEDCITPNDWYDLIKEMVDELDFEFAEDFLLDVGEQIETKGFISLKQQNAIVNVYYTNR